MLYVARHPPTAAPGICYGQSDVAMALAPADAARALEVQLAAVVPSSIACSPWARARTVAEILGERWNVPVSVDARLSELSFGEWEGRAYTDLERDDPVRFAAWMRDWRTSSPPGGERIEDLVARVGRWVDAWRATPLPTLLVTHAGVVRTFRALARGRRYEDLALEAVEPLRVESFPWEAL
ncbi:MAG TPA: histidine phosphatase family protein [Polyangiaceae bacterium]